VSKFRYTWRPPNPDFRDFRADTTGLTARPEVDPRGNMPDMFDQLDLGSCTANGDSAMIEYWMHKFLNLPFKLHRPSRLFIYWGERMLEGSLGQGDVGAYGHDGLKFTMKYGWVPEHVWPYKTNMYDVEPPKEVWKEAAGNVLLNMSYKSVARDVDAIKAVLSNKQTMGFGFTVYDSFEREAVLKSGYIPMPSKSESALGGHWVVAVGYLESEPNHVLVRNSWGTEFEGGPLYGQIPGGKKHPGYFLMPWDYLMESNLSSDFQTIPIPA
jgi:C1A family cysteine protease